MTQAAINYAKVLYELSVDRGCVEAAKKLYDSAPALKEILESPIVPKNKKRKIIDDIFSSDDFPKEWRNFLKIISDYGQIDELEETFQAYYKYWDEKNNILRAELIFSKTPEEEQVEQAKEFLEGKYPDRQTIIRVKVVPENMGGLQIRVDQEEYDWSYEGRLKQLEKKLTGR